MTYFASFTANNGSTSNTKPYEFASKAKAIKDIKAIVAGEHFPQQGNKSSYCVWDENEICVAQGSLYGCGQWRKDEEAVGHNYKEV